MKKVSDKIIKMVVLGVVWLFLYKAQQHSRDTSSEKRLPYTLHLQRYSEHQTNVRRHDEWRYDNKDNRNESHSLVPPPHSKHYHPEEQPEEYNHRNYTRVRSQKFRCDYCNIPVGLADIGVASPKRSGGHRCNRECCK